MPEALAALFATDGLIYLCLAYLVAGVVRGFTGFGTALIVVPVAGIFLDPFDILFMIAITGVCSNVVLVPEAWRAADRAEVGVLSLAAVLGVPVGVFLLGMTDAIVIRWIVAGITAATLVAVVSGWQWRGRLGNTGLGAIGAGAGVVGGLTALTGPIAITFYLANARKAAAVRGNMILFLAALDILLIGNVLVAGAASLATLLLGLCVSVPYLLSITVGKALFDPDREQLYRVCAYIVVSAAVLTGLPIWE